ncbi:MAG: carboxypeptidase regulatory-like domain-containing protein [Bacteroidetes bacterium]|nr:carboxypeptidase regulatory-like domain-containing protein [Bacteroidota bacterium]
MPEELEHAHFSCTQAELYSICDLGWNMVNDRQLTMAGRFPIYTPTYITDRKADIDAARNLPDFQNSSELSEEDRVILMSRAGDAIPFWDVLERYINQAFASNKGLIKPNVEAAGKLFYEKATRQEPNWEDLKMMLKDGNDYITANVGGVLAPVIAPSFQADYIIQKDAYDLAYDTFILEKTAHIEDTSAKRVANNGIYDVLMAMLPDLKIILPAGTKHQATFKFLKDQVSSAGSAGLKGKVTDASSAAITGVSLMLAELSLTVLTNASGDYDFGNIASGTYTLVITKAGYQSVTESVVILVGTTSTKNYQLAGA